MGTPSSLRYNYITIHGRGGGFEGGGAWGGGGSVGLVAKWLPILQALLSLTFLQTLPELVTPLKGHMLYLRASAHAPMLWQRRPKGLGMDLYIGPWIWVLIRLWKQRSKHVNKYVARLLRLKH